MALNPRSSKVKELIRIKFLSSPLQKTKSAKDSVLDLGCGWGFYFKINPYAYGIDMDRKCIKYLKSLGYKAILGDIRGRLPFENNFFEWIICHDVLEHLELEEVKKILTEIFRTLKKDGKFLIIIPNKKGYKSGIKRNVGHKHFITPEEILELSEKKFIPEKIFSHPFSKTIGKYFTHNKEVIILKKWS